MLLMLPESSIMLLENIPNRGIIDNCNLQSSYFYSNFNLGERKPTSLTSVWTSVFMPDGTTQTDIRTENTDVREVGFHPPFQFCAESIF
jgi:hypothetical protein